MRSRPFSPRVVGFLALTLWLGACAGGSSSPGSTGTAGSTGSAGSTGAAGTSGTAGNSGGQGTAGTTGSAGSTGTAGTAGTTGAAGATGTAGTTGAAGSTGAAGTTGTAGAGTAGATGTAGAGAGGSTMGAPSAGCNMPPPAADSATAWVKHDIDVTGVDPAFISTYPPNAGNYTWTHRNYFIRLPKNYDITKAYPVAIGGSGCGGSETVGSEGGYSVLGLTAGETEGIQVSMSYVPSAAVNSCAGFADDFTNSPEPPYIHAMIADLEAKYCVDKSKIFLSGYSSGAWQATLSGCTNNDELRGYGVQIGGGLRLKRPPCKPNPIAAMYVVGTMDTANPIGPLATPNDDSYGSAPSRDDILKRNGCTGTATAMWDPTYPLCVQYTGCPAKYPVVWCEVPFGHNPGPTAPGLDLYRYTGMWKFYSTLP